MIMQTYNQGSPCEIGVSQYFDGTGKFRLFLRWYLGIQGAYSEAELSPISTDDLRALVAKATAALAIHDARQAVIQEPIQCPVSIAQPTT